MKGYVYAEVRAGNKVENVLLAVIDGETNSQIEKTYSERYDVDYYGLTYTPAFGAVGGLVQNENAEQIQA